MNKFTLTVRIIGRTEDKDNISFNVLLGDYEPHIIFIPLVLYKTMAQDEKILKKYIKQKIYENMDINVV